MSAFLISALACLTMLAGAVAGAGLRRLLPAHHLDDQSKDIVRLGSALLATMSALVLGLLITSAKNAYDLQRSEVRQIAAKLVLLDNQLNRWGPEAQPARQVLRASMPAMVERIWGERAVQRSTGAPFQPSPEGELVYAALENLTPQTEVQRLLKNQAFTTIAYITELRVLLSEQADSGLPAPLLIVLVFWLSALLASFTLFSRVNPTSACALLIIALSAAGAIFMIEELASPFNGLLRIPTEPLGNALGVLAP